MVNEISAISVFLLFLTFLFNSIDKRANEILSERIPETKQKEKLRIYHCKLNSLIYLNAIPTTIVYLITTYVIFPKTLSIIVNSHFSLWDFDVLSTLFVFIEFGLVGFSIYALNRTRELIIQSQKNKIRS